YPGKSAADIAAAILGEMERETESMVVIHEDPSDLASRLPVEAGAPTSLPMMVNTLIGQHLQASDRWHVVKRIESKRYGRLVVYRLAAEMPEDRRDIHPPQAAREEM